MIPEKRNYKRLTDIAKNRNREEKGGNVLGSCLAETAAECKCSCVCLIIFCNKIYNDLSLGCTYMIPLIT